LSYAHPIASRNARHALNWSPSPALINARTDRIIGKTTLFAPAPMSAMLSSSIGAAAAGSSRQNVSAFTNLAFAIDVVCPDARATSIACAARVLVSSDAPAEPVKSNATEPMSSSARDVRCCAESAGSASSAASPSASSARISS
jgi:hypothetical protein